MSVTTHGVYLVTDEDEVHLGSVGDVLDRGLFPCLGFPMRSAIMDIVAELISNPLKNCKVVVIEIRE